MGKERVITFEGDTVEGVTVTVTWDRDLCIHVGECTRASGELFESGRDPWCDPRGVDAAAIREVVARCPSGALAARFADPSLDETAPAENTVTVADGGPLYFRGALAIEGAPGRAPALAHRAALCRCGRSGNKPYCDDSHLEAAFEDHGAVGEVGTPLEERGGTLAVRVVRDGPIRIAGNLTIRSGSGRAAWQGTSTALCRCGLSRRRPFCDGSHRKSGWSDEG